MATRLCMLRFSYCGEPATCQLAKTSDSECSACSCQGMPNMCCRCNKARCLGRAKAWTWSRPWHLIVGMDALSSAAEAYAHACNLQAGKYGSGLRAFQDIQAAGMQPNVVTYCGEQPFGRFGEPAKTSTWHSACVAFKLAGNGVQNVLSDTSCAPIAWRCADA